MRRYKWLLVTLAVLLLTGCSLARPEAAEDSGDRLAGFYLMYMQEDSDRFYNNPYREEYGVSSVKAEQLGTLRFPREVLFAVEDEVGNYTFPGMEGGYSLFMLQKEEEYGAVNAVVSNMFPGEENSAVHVSGEGTSWTISGIVYAGPPLGAENWNEFERDGIWMCYRVYQTEDGRVYIAGDGNSFGGSGGFEYHENQTRSTTDWEGETAAESIDIYVKVETVDRVDRLVVTQFDENNTVVRSDVLPLRADLPEVTCEAAAEWVLVEEEGAAGVVRTAYNVPEANGDPVSHMLVVLDADGLGRAAYLTLCSPGSSST